MPWTTLSAGECPRVPVVVGDNVVFRLWCSIENDHGYHRRLGSKWAYCGQDCPRDKDEKCSNKVNGKESHPHYIAQEKPTFDYVEDEENN